MFETLQKRLTALLNKLRDHSLMQWRRKVRSWTISAKALYAYIRNQAPPPITAILAPLGPTNSPQVMVDSLNSYWSHIESWPESMTLESTWELVEDQFAAFLPPCALPL